MSSSANNAVFLSYASEDAEAARRICEALRSAGVEVWFDQSELRGGDAWDAKIRKQIKECALFVPIISTNTNARPEGYFRLEWKLAVDRSHLVADDHAFLFPIALGDVNDATARVPEKFREVQWTRLRPAGFGGSVRQAQDKQALDGPGVEAFCTQLKGLLEGRDAPPSRPGLPEGDTGRRRPIETSPPTGSRWIWGGVALVVVVLGLALWRPWQPGVNKPLAPALGTPAIAVSDKSILVLPLENLSPDPDNAFFTDGIHAEIIATLQRIPDLKVISRDSAVAFKGSTAPLAEKAQKVGVAHAISGNVRRAGTSVRVQLELRRARDDALLWAQDYNKELGQGVIVIQTDIADQVARVLQARERRGTNAGAQFMTANPEAYDLFLKADQTYATARGADGLQKTIAALEQALTLDPAFSSAARLLASALIQSYTSERNPAVKLQYAREAKRWAEKARQLLPGGAGDHALASYYTKIEPDNARALALAENAIKALPNDAAVFNAFAIALSEAGREAEAIDRYRQAISLDPESIVFRYNLVGNLGRLRRRADYERAVAEYIAAQGPRTRPSPLKTLNDYRLDGTLPNSLDGFDAQTRLLWLQRSRRDAEALSLMESMLAGPDLHDEARWSLWIAKCDVLRRTKREPEAAQAALEANAWLEKVNALPTLDASEREGRLAVTLARLGRVDEAITAGRRYVGAISPQNQVRRRRTRELELAELYSYLGRPRECVELLAKLLQVPSDISVSILRAEPIWDNVREDAGFKALLADPKNSAPL